MTEAEIKALIKAVWGVELTEEEKQAAQRCIDGMSDWQTMTYAELDRIVEEEAKARGSWVVVPFENP